LEKGEFVGEKRCFSVITSRVTKSVKEVIDEKIDLRIRVTNGNSEPVLKHSEWGSKESRREINISFNTKDFTEMIDFIRLIGFNKVVLQATATRVYKYNGVEFALVNVPNWGYYFEAEILTEANKARIAY
jgi:adenylate cyclase class IV